MNANTHDTATPSTSNNVGWTDFLWGWLEG